MRQALKKARTDRAMTQKQMADKLGISIRYYKGLESGELPGSIRLWDALEDLTGINQRVLRDCQTGPVDSL